MSNLTGSRQPRPPYGTGPPSRVVPTRRAPYGPAFTGMASIRPDEAPETG